MALASVCLAAWPLTASGAPVADSVHPLVVGNHQFTASEVRAKGARDLIANAWVDREADVRGIALDPVALQEVFDYDRRGRDDASYAKDLKRSGETIAARQVELAAGMKHELVSDSINREAGNDVAKFEAAWLAYAERGRATTTCIASVALEYTDACANLPRVAEPCFWFSLEQACGYRKRGRFIYWSGQPDLITSFLDAPAAAEATSDPDLDNGIKRVAQYLQPRFPKVLWRCDTDPDDVFYFSCPYRRDVVTVLFAVARIHTVAKTKWTIPATNAALFSRN